MKLSRTLRNGYNFAVVKTDFASSSFRALFSEEKTAVQSSSNLCKVFREKTSLSAFMVFRSAAATSLLISEIESPISNCQFVCYLQSDHLDAICQKESNLRSNVALADTYANVSRCRCSSVVFPVYVLYNKRLCGCLSLLFYRSCSKSVPARRVLG